MENEVAGFLVYSVQGHVQRHFIEIEVDLDPPRILKTDIVYTQNKTFSKNVLQDLRLLQQKETHWIRCI